MKIPDEIEKIADQIEAVLTENDLPAQNQKALRRLLFLADQLSGVDSYAREKALEIADKAERYYSARKHETHRSGAAGLYQEMRNRLGRIRNQAKIRASNE